MINKPVKVLMICRIIPPDYTGAGKAATKIASRLEKKGSLAGIMTSTSKPLPKEFSYLESKILRITDTFYNSSFLKPISLLLKLISILFITIKERNNFEILHVFSTSWECLFGILVSKMLGKKTILEITLMGGDNPGLVSKELFGISTLKRNIQYKKADRIVCLSPEIVNDCIKAGISKEKCVLIPRSVDIEKFAGAKDINTRDRIKSKFGAKKSNKIILFVGSLIERKGAHLIPLIMREVVKKEPNCLIWILGNGAINNEEIKLTAIFEAQIKEFNLHDKILLWGRVDNVYEFMKASDIFFFPSSKEGLPNVVLEAMSSGVIPILKKVPGLSDFIIPNNTFPEVATDDIREYVEELLSLLNLVDDIEQYDSLRNIARNRISEKFSIKIVDAKYTTLYKELIT